MRIVSVFILFTKVQVLKYKATWYTNVDKVYYVLRLGQSEMATVNRVKS